jgi:Protein of unknown function (DUF4231)
MTTPFGGHLFKFWAKCVQALVGWNLRPEVHMPSLQRAIRVGVIGGLRIDDRQELEERAGEVMAAIREAVRIAKARLADPAAGPLPHVQLSVISSLTAGVDQILACAAMREGFELQAALPASVEASKDDVRRNCGCDESTTPEERHKLETIAVDEYLALIAKATRVIETGTAAVPGEEDYLAAAESILASSNILVAVIVRQPVWGITLNIVEKALEHDIPVVWIPAEGGTAKFLRGNQEGLDGWIPELGEALAETVRELLTRSVAPNFESDCSRISRLIEWFECRFTRTVDLRYNEREWREIWPNPTEHDKPLSATLGLIDAGFRPFAVWADYRASAYKRLYRGAFLTNAALGVLAVALALVAVVAPWAGPHAKIAELGVLAMMSLILSASIKGRWRDRWTAYRALYQQLHHRAWQMVLGLGGGQGGAVKKGNLPMDAEPVSWAVGIAHGSLDEAYLEAIRLRILTRLVRRQRRYFDSEANKNEKRHRLLEHMVQWWLRTAAGLTSLYLVARLCFGETHSPHISLLSGWATVGGALLPVCATMVIGIALFEEHGRLSKRYREMSDSLDMMERHLTLPHYAMPDAQQPSSRLRRESLRRTLKAVLGLADDELSYWQRLFESKTVEDGTGIVA